jgi:hypothetical protein
MWVNTNVMAATKIKSKFPYMGILFFCLDTKEPKNQGFNQKY